MSRANFDMCWRSVQRQVVACTIEKHMEAALVSKALRSAIKSRRNVTGTMFHSDSRGQYKSKAVRRLLARKQMRQSMIFLCNCYDNATAESFFGTLKSKFEKCQLSSFQEAESVVFDYIEAFYDRKRLRSFLGYLSLASLNAA
jgi:transposase InsO family protein